MWDSFKEVITGLNIPVTFATILSFIVYLTTIIKGVSNIKSLKFKNSETLTSVKGAVLFSVKSEIATAVKTEMAIYMPELIENSRKQTEILKEMAKVFTLQQENTPESKLAILQVIENLGIISSKTIESSKKIVKNNNVAIAVKKEKNEKALEKIIEQTHTEIM